MLKRRGARTDPCGMPFLRHCNLFLLLFLVNLQLLSMIMWTMCLSGSNCSSFEMRPWCHTLSWASVRSINTAPAFLAKKLSSMSCVNRLTWSSALQPFLLWCTLEDVLLNSCILFTESPPPNCTHVCKYPGLNKQVP